jgi:hypothetical protein
MDTIRNRIPLGAITKSNDEHYGLTGLCSKYNPRADLRNLQTKRLFRFLLAGYYVDQWSISVWRTKAELTINGIE